MKSLDNLSDNEIKKILTSYPIVELDPACFAGVIAADGYDYRNQRLQRIYPELTGDWLCPFTDTSEWSVINTMLIDYVNERYEPGADLYELALEFYKNEKNELSNDNYWAENSDVAVAILCLEYEQEFSKDQWKKTFAEYLGKK